MTFHQSAKMSVNTSSEDVNNLYAEVDKSKKKNENESFKQITTIELQEELTFEYEDMNMTSKPPDVEVYEKASSLGSEQACDYRLYDAVGV